MPHAIRIHDHGGPEVMQWEEIATPEPYHLGTSNRRNQPLRGERPTVSLDSRPLGTESDPAMKLFLLAIFPAALVAVTLILHVLRGGAER